MAGIQRLDGIGGIMDDAAEFTRDSALAIQRTYGWCERLAPEPPGLVDYGMPGAEGTDVLALNGIIGARVRALWEGNLSRLDWHRDFLAPFRERREAAGHIGMGKTLSVLNGVARLYGGAAAELRERVTADLLGVQEDSGYLGILAGEHHTCRTWDAHEQGYLLQELTELGRRLLGLDPWPGAAALG